MENKFRIIDIVLTVILVVLMSIGIGIGFANSNKFSGELTTENHKEYLSIKTNYLAGVNESDYSIVFTPTKRFKVTKVIMTILIEGQSIDSQTIEISFSAKYNKPYTYEITLKTNSPSYSNFNSDWYKIDCKVISISGQFSR